MLQSLISLLFDKNASEADVDKYKNSLRPLLRILYLAIFFIVSVFIFNIIFSFGINTSISSWLDRCTPVPTGSTGTDISGKLGPFGDFFGGMLNPILSFLTLLGLIATIALQRIEIADAKASAEKGNKALAIQSLEATFFQAVDLHHKIVDDLKFDASIVPIPEDIKKDASRAGNLEAVKDSHVNYAEGRRSFEAAIKAVTKYYPNSPEKSANVYRHIQENHNYVFGHYFRHLYQCLKIIDNVSETILDNKEKCKYTSLLRAQLSSNELYVLFLNCLDNMVDKGEFKNLLIKYEMLEHIPFERRGALYYARGTEIAIADEKMHGQYLALKDITPRGYYGDRGAYGRNQYL